MLKFLRNWKMISGCALIFALAFLIPANVSASTNAAPTVIKINSFKAYSLVAPVISGVTPHNTNVLVYIDGVFAGSAKTQNNKTASDSFYFQAFGLEEGNHPVYLIAEDKESLVRSKKSVMFDIKVGALPAPTLVVPNQNTITGKVKPLIEGFTKSGTFVHLYIDGVYNGKTKVVEHFSGTAHFSYNPFLNLEIGKHKMWAVSENIDGKKSLVSAVVEFNIEQKMPAPTIFDPVINNNTVYNQPYIVGLAKNNSKIRIFIDHVLTGEFQVESHSSGTANFAYKARELKSGEHFVYTTSIDSRGKESIWSNIVYFEVNKPVIAMISENAAEEEVIITDEASSSAQDTIAQGRVRDFLVFADLYESNNKIRLNDGQYQELQSLLDKKNELVFSKEEEEKLKFLLKSKDIKIDSSEKTEINIKDVLDKDSSASTSEISGPIDEDKQQQSKLGWNAVIFILFLVSVIAWIFWVNRELIKEKKEQEDKK